MIKEALTKLGIEIRRLKLALRKLVPSSLLGRSLLILITPILLAQVIATFIFFDRHWDNVTRRLTSTVAGEIAILAEDVEREKTLSKEDMQLYNNKLGLIVSYSEDDTLDINNTKPWRRGVVNEFLTNSLHEQTRKNFIVRQYASDSFIEVDVAVYEDKKGVLKFLIPEKRLVSTTAHIFLLWMVGSSLFLLAIAIVFMRNQIKPIKRLALAANRFGRGLEVQPIKPSGAREVRQAAEAFENMRERLQRQIDQRTTMLAGVSHDLRTPLTRIRLQLELMDESDDIVAIKSDLDEMERMVDGYLTFVRDESGQEAELVDISNMLTRIVEVFSKQGTVISSTIDEGMKAVVRHDALYRCVSNIVSNAKKYGHNIWVKSYKSKRGIEIVIEDDGPGIPDDKKAEVFRPFYRMEDSRNQQTGGVGLGLSIARDIIHSHGGNIMLEDSNRGGLRVVIDLPVV